MPCFRNLNDERFAPITERERKFVDAVVAFAPDVLPPIVTQLDHARTCDDGTGWLVFRDTDGTPCPWPEGYPFDILPNSQSPGPQGCYSIMLWFHGNGQLEAVEFLMLEHNGPLQLDQLTEWLTADSSVLARLRKYRGSFPPVSTFDRLEAHDRG